MRMLPVQQPIPDDKERATPCLEHGPRQNFAIAIWYPSVLESLPREGLPCKEENFLPKQERLPQAARSRSPRSLLPKPNSGPWTSAYSSASATILRSLSRASKNSASTIAFSRSTATRSEERRVGK